MRLDYDPLTETICARSFEAELIATYSYAAAHQQHQPALFVVQLVNYESIRQLYGQDFANIAIVTLAVTLKSAFRASDYVGRTGEYEFAVLLPMITAPITDTVAQKIGRMTGELRASHQGVSVKLVVHVAAMILESNRLAQSVLCAVRGRLEALSDDTSLVIVVEQDL